jgi:pentatricopeptide repeat protein
MARYNLGLLYARLGQLPQAVQQYQKAIQIDPEFADAYAALAWIFAREGVRLDEGLELAGKALRLSPDNNWSWDVLAEVHISRGEMDKAREIFQRMIQQEPGREYWRERLREVGN